MFYKKPSDLEHLCDLLKAIQETARQAAAQAHNPSRRSEVIENSLTTIQTLLDQAKQVKT